VDDKKVESEIRMFIQSAKECLYEDRASASSVLKYWSERLLALLPREETLEECVEWYLDTAPLGGGYGSHEARRRLLEALKRRKAGK